MKFLICGLGSIGRRHAENLEKIEFKSKDIWFLRRHAGSNKFGDKFLKNHAGAHRIFYNLTNALSYKPNVVFITNPTSLHIPVALKAVEANCNLFIEKPLSHTMDDVDRLIKIVNEKKLKVCVAYQLRFHPLFQQIQRWLEQKKIGQVVSAHAEMAERITDWHPWEDYKNSYACRANLGGGAILTQSHELDYLYALFGPPKKIFASGGKLSELEIDVEDTVDCLIKFANNITTTLHLDYIQRPPKRTLKIIGTEGTIYWNYFKNKLKLVFYKNEPGIACKIPDFDRNEMYLRELKDFLLSIERNTQPLVNLESGKNTLQMALDIKKFIE